MTSIFIGSAAGILGLTGLVGFLFYFISYIIVSISIAAKMNFDVGKYFPKQTLPTFLLNGLGGQLVAYIMYWTLMYALVHLY